MVATPGEYRWSSYRGNAFGEDDPVLTPHPSFLALAAIPEERRDAYRAFSASRWRKMPSGPSAMRRNSSGHSAARLFASMSQPGPAGAQVAFQWAAAEPTASRKVVSDPTSATRRDRASTSSYRPPA